MDLLNAAIQAELNANYKLALRYYWRLSKQGSSLDRIGIYQAIARCFERLGVRKKAGYWHQRAGQGYTKLPTLVMSEQDRAYYAMLEFRSAIQNYAPVLVSRRTVADDYLRTLSVCLRAGGEGYSHEMLFAAHLCAKLNSFKKAAQFFAEAAFQFKSEKQRNFARESFLLASMYARRSGNVRLAEKFQENAKALR